MAKKRMFRLDVLETDAFMDMPLTAQALYFHLCLRADDDGFVGNPKMITRNIGASIDDLKLLITKRFVLIFEDGVIVIKHWRLHNNLTMNRYQETKYLEDKAQLFIKENGAYSEHYGDDIDDSRYIESGKRQSRQDKDKTKTSPDKNSIGKVSIGEDSIGKDNNLNTLHSSRCSSDPHCLNTLQDESSGSSYSNLTPCYTPTSQDIQLIINTWNSQNCTKNISEIPPLSNRWNNTLLCIRNNLEAFLQAIREIDDQAFFTKRFRERNQPAIYDSFVEPNNYLKYLEGNYREEYRGGEKHGCFWDDPIASDGCS